MHDTKCLYVILKIVLPLCSALPLHKTEFSKLVAGADPEIVVHLPNYKDNKYCIYLSNQTIMLCHRQISGATSGRTFQHRSAGGSVSTYRQIRARSAAVSTEKATVLPRDVESMVQQAAEAVQRSGGLHLFEKGGGGPGGRVGGGGGHLTRLRKVLRSQGVEGGSGVGFPTVHGAAGSRQRLCRGQGGCRFLGEGREGGREHQKKV